LIPLAISRVWAATRDSQALLTDVLPNTLDAQQQALESFSVDRLIDPALAVWKHMIAARQAIPIQSAFPLEEILLAANRNDDARDVWREALAASGNPDEANPGSSLIFNGGFEFDATGGGLDWHLVPTAGVNYDYDSANAHSGKRALRLTFDGEQNPDLQSVTQTVLVQPSTSYHFEGYLRTAGITTESGPRFFIAFAGTTRPPVILPTLTGDHPWAQFTADFTTAPDEHLLVVMLYRPKSTRFKNNLAGTAWVDDVSIVSGGPSRPIQ
jgi:hypothetical protein